MSIYINLLINFFNNEDTIIHILQKLSRKKKPQKKKINKTRKIKYEHT